MVVYLIVAPLVAQLIVTLIGLLEVMAPGLTPGVATVLTDALGMVTERVLDWRTPAEFLATI